MLDGYGRNINYLRVSVTDRCNLRCRYCMPEEGISHLGHSSILSLEDIARLIKISTDVGVNKIRLTGGEPLVRKNLSQLIDYIAAIPRIDDIAITTNGILFADMATEFKKAGLQRINFSLDSLVDEKFKYITRRGDLQQVRKAIFKALELDMHPIKINVVVINGFNDNEILDFVELAYNYPFHIRFIEFMPIGDLFYWKKERMLSCDVIKSRVEQKYELITARTIKGNGPAKYYSINGGQGTVGFISPMSNHFCGECNRIRMTADGRLRACLYEKTETDLGAALYSGASDEELRQLFINVINRKPARHHMDDGWGVGNQRKMYQIGG
ncbi:MAG: GTP 3',8-cyclase MoaA [Syntrophomonadaceae bacterium]|nr:GTP 3',8-cyclase MoaA [Syntrophomonadaceae bacterium]